MNIVFALIGTYVPDQERDTWNPSEHTVGRCVSLADTGKKQDRQNGGRHCKSQALGRAVWLMPQVVKGSGTP